MQTAARKSKTTKPAKLVLDATDPFGAVKTDVPKGYTLVTAPDGSLHFVREGHELVKCTGEAHSNGHIDHCMRCLNHTWGWVAQPVVQFNARDLKIGERVQVSSGAFYPTRTVEVVEQKQKQKTNEVLGDIFWTECVVVDGWESEGENPELYRNGAPVRLEGNETLLGIGWKRVTT